jgi:hypothetical protein
MDKSKNQIEWIKLFDKYDILDKINLNGIFKISSKQINEFREARLMTKFDHKSQLPKIFYNNGLSILPISRGSYLISKFEAFKDFEENPLELTRITTENTLESIDFDNITGEAAAINCAFVSGILKDFLNDGELMPTVNGRMSSGSFSFDINLNEGNSVVHVENSQIEIDAGFEGEKSLCLIEAKNSLSNDFLIRQLYYPFRLWHDKINKKVRTIFMIYSNGVYHLREYSFLNPGNYNSICLIKENRYIVSRLEIEEEQLNNEFISKVIQDLEWVLEPEIPFPQANSFERVINLLEILNIVGQITKEELLSNYGFTMQDSIDPRQIDYYVNAGRYLGFVSKRKIDKVINYGLSSEGRMLFKLSLLERQKTFVKSILSHKVFKEVLQLYFFKGEAPSKDEIVFIMKECGLHEIGTEKTFKRRSSTIMAWINWILDQAID